MFCSRNLRTFLILSLLSYWQMELRFSLLFFQKLSSSIGLGLLPFLRAFSGSCLRTCLICLLH